MYKLLTAISVLCFWNASNASAARSLDGTSYCRPAISNGMFGQPKGVRPVCIAFADGIATDSNSTLGGNPPLRAPYTFDGKTVKFGSSIYTLSMNRSTLMTVKGAATAGIIYMLVVTDVSQVYLPQSWSSNAVNPESLASKEQLRLLQQLMLFEISSQRSNEDSLAIINANLEALGLPVVGANPEIELIGNNSSFVGHMEGAKIKDDSHLYCLPCSVGRGQYSFGITVLPKKP